MNAPYELDWTSANQQLLVAEFAAHRGAFDVALQNYLQQAVRRVYGIEAAKSCYRYVFMEQLGIRPAARPEPLAAS